MSVFYKLMAQVPTAHDPEITQLRCELMCIGATTDDIAKMEESFFRLARTTLDRDRDFVIDGLPYSIWRCRQGQPMIPNNIREWAMEFVGVPYMGQALHRAITLFDNAEHIWKEMNAA